MILRSRRVVTQNAVMPASIHVEDGKIAAVSSYEDAGTDFGDLVILPGLVDTHVHINEPGRADWEGFETATRAAAAGGVTTLIEMPLNSVPATTTVAAYLEKLAAAEGKLFVDTGFWGGVVPGNTAELEPLWRAGVFGFKCFLTPSGVDEFEHVTEADLRVAMPVLARLGAPLLVHAELPAFLREAAGGGHEDWLASRPPEAEMEAIAMMIRLAREYGVRVHIVHLCATEAVPLIHATWGEDVTVTVETCPHYLTFAAEEIPASGTEFKCAPPLRSAKNRERLREALLQGGIDMVVSDHSPSPPEMKRGDFRAAWGGIASLELGLSAIYTLFDSLPGVFTDIARWMAEAPAGLAGLDRKGLIAPGYDADLVIFDADARWTVDPARLHQRHKVTPYAGREMKGRVLATYLRGEKIYDEGAFPIAARGRVLKRFGPQDFLACCGSRRWVEAMSAAAPFDSAESAAAHAARIWNSLAAEDWLEAFAAHPRIGDRSATGAAASEQSGVRGAAEGTLDELARLNREYERRFGYIYIVCASGKSAEEMLAILRLRLANDPETELRIAAAEQLAITQLRLEELRRKGIL
jgi:allantoinase